MDSGGIERRIVRSAIPGGLLALSLALTGCAMDSALGSPTPVPTPVITETPAPPTGIVIVGDSLAAGDGNDATPADPGSWRMHLTGNVEVVGGWWRNGATTKAMADNLPLARGDVLLLMGGTNDVSRDIPPKATLRSIERIVQKVAADDVILCAIPPFSAQPERAQQLNAELQELAAESGWAWVDPWEYFRDGDDWSEAATTDGTHPTEPVYRSVGLVLSEAIEHVTITRVG
jgi:lysophospholipase L1-like esterase